MSLAAFDAEAIGQLVILILLGAGSLVKKFFEARQVVDDAKGQGEIKRRIEERSRSDIFDRLAEIEEEMGSQLQDPWGRAPEGKARAEAPAALQLEELVGEPVLVEEAYDPGAPTREASIEGPSLEGASLEGASFDQGTVSSEPWRPEERIRASVFEDIERSVAKDITEHVAADMSGGVRGEASAVKAQAKLQSKRGAHRGWRDAVIAAELLGQPVALKGPATQPAGLRNE